MTYNSDWLRLLSSGRITKRCPLLQQYTTLSASRKFHLSSRSGMFKGRTVSSSDSQTAQRLGWSMGESLRVSEYNCNRSRYFEEVLLSISNPVLHVRSGSSVTDAGREETA